MQPRDAMNQGLCFLGGIGLGAGLMYLLDPQMGRRPGQRWDIFQANWAPATRALAGTVGGALVAWGLNQRFPVACVAGTIGLGLLARSITNVGLLSLLSPSGTAGYRPPGRGAQQGRQTRQPAPTRTQGQQTARQPELAGERLPLM